MARRTHVHIGTLKSGTTYLQSFCNLNRRRLREAGCLWLSSVDNVRATDDLLGTKRKKPGQPGAWEEFDPKIRAFEGDALISSETLASLNDARMARLVDALSPAEVHVVLTARDLGRVVPSQWQETTRNRLTIPWSDYLAAICGEEGSDRAIRKTFRRKHDIAGIVSRWSRHVPLDRISIVTVPPPGSPPGLLAERFISALGLTMPESEQPTRVHESLGAHSAELLRRLNSRCDDLEWMHYQFGIKQSMARYTLAARSSQEPPIRLNSAQLAWFHEEALRTTKAIAESGVTVVGDLQDLVPALTAPEVVVDPGETTDAALLDAALDGIVGLARMFADARMAHDSMVRELHENLPPATLSEREEFNALEGDAVAGDLLPGKHRRERFLRWRLAQSRSTPDT